MKVKHLDLLNIEALPLNTALLIGTFDGVHIGHKFLIEKAKLLSDKVAVLIIYSNKKITKTHQKSGVLMTLDDRVKVFKNSGADSIYLLNLGEELLKLTPAEFIENIIIKLAPNYVVVGSDFHFGFKASGTPDDLISLSKNRYQSLVLDPLYFDKEKVSTSLIKEALLNGETNKASTLLGGYYTLTGLVTKGFGLGNKLGFPTANVALDPAYFLPAHGVYLVRVHVLSNTYFGMASLGYHPTVNEVKLPLLEVNIFDFNQDIYHQPLTVEFLAFLRPELKFDTLEALVTKIEEDRVTCNKLIKEGDY